MSSLTVPGFRSHLHVLVLHTELFSFSCYHFETGSLLQPSLAWAPHPPTSASRVQGLQACTTTPGSDLCLHQKYTTCLSKHAYLPWNPAISWLIFSFPLWCFGLWALAFPTTLWLLPGLAYAMRRWRELQTNISLVSGPCLKTKTGKHPIANSFYLWNMIPWYDHVCQKWPVLTEPASSQDESFKEQRGWVALCVCVCELR